MPFCCLCFTQKTGYVLRISDWSSDVGSADLAFRRRRREMQLGLAVEAVDLCLEALDDLVAVETEVIGVAAHETHRVGGARQILELAALDGVEIGIADAEHIGDGPQVMAKLLARATTRAIGRASGRERVGKYV